jgi:tetratricopeptide (TPR) repeat protein
MKSQKTMKGRLIILSVLFLLVTVGLVAREKTEMIGKFKWYTEQNSLEEIKAQAKKENKPILAVFSATWCGPCQHVKKTVFKTDEFKKISDKALLLYIEQTTKEGAAYNKKYNIKAFPTFKIISNDGVMLDTGNPTRTVDGFAEWIDDVKKGNNFYELSRKLKKNPKDREALVRITGKMGYGETEKKIEFLKQAIDLNPDLKDPVSQEAYEKLAGMLANRIPYMEGKEQSEYLEANRKDFTKVVDSYYPDGFKYNLKGINGLATIMEWFVKDKNYNRAIAIFDDYYKQKSGKIDFGEDIVLLTSAVPAYLGAGQVDTAREWVDKTVKYAKETDGVNKDKGFVYYYSGMLRNMVDHFGNSGDLKTAQGYAALAYSETDRLGEKRLSEYMVVDYAKKYGLSTKLALELLEKRIKDSKGYSYASAVVNKAHVLHKIKKKDEARQELMNLYKNEDFFKTLTKKELPRVLNSIAWAMVEMKMVDQHALEIAKKAVAAEDSDQFMDTLACVYAELGKYKEAVDVETKAAEKTDPGPDKEQYLSKIAEWKAKLKETN